MPGWLATATSSRRRLRGPCSSQSRGPAARVCGQYAVDVCNARKQLSETYQSRKGQLGHQQLGTLLIPPDLPQGHGSRLISRLLPRADHWHRRASTSSGCLAPYAAGCALPSHTRPARTRSHGRLRARHLGEGVCCVGRGWKVLLVRNVRVRSGGRGVPA